MVAEILQDPSSGVHLRIATLEAAANTTEDIGLNATFRDMTLAKHESGWLRSKALNAFAETVNNDWGPLEALDRELAQATDDATAPEVRVELLCLTPECAGILHLRLLSILEQAASARKGGHVLGGFRSLIDLPSDSDLNAVLDGASRLLTPKKRYDFELRLIFEKWFKPVSDMHGSRQNS